VRADDSKTLSAIFGADSGSLLSSGDEVADQEAKRHFVERADERTCLERESKERVVLSVGTNDWPFAIPLLRGEAGWYFDTANGVEEIVNRRIGRNELYAIAIGRAYVNAQYEYYARAPMGKGLNQYAQRIHSTEGERDGLYWPAAEGEAESPLGPLIAAAERAGYGTEEASDGGATEPYHGYVFRILTAQGPNVPGGEKSYITDKGMTLGFGMLAYPIEYGNSGIMTFVVNQRGIVYQKDLGAETGKIDDSIKVFDPDSTWEPVAM